MQCIWLAHCCSVTNFRTQSLTYGSFHVKLYSFLKFLSDFVSFRLVSPRQRQRFGISLNTENIQKSFMAKVNPSGVVMVKLTPAKPFQRAKWAQPFFFRPRPLSAYCAYPSPHSASFTRYVFLPLVLPRPRSAHYARPSPRPHLARSSLLYARLTLLTGVHRPCLMFAYKHVVLCRILEGVSIDVKLISKLAFLYLALKPHSPILCKPKTEFLVCNLFSVAFPTFGTSHVHFLWLFIGSLCFVALSWLAIASVFVESHFI